MWRILTVLLLASCSRSTGRLESKAGKEVLGGRPIYRIHHLARSVVGIVNVATNEVCTGTLITTSHVLTAAHCLNDRNENLRVIFETKLSLRPKLYRLVEASAQCDRFQFGSQSKVDLCDVAVIKLHGEIPDGYQPAELETDPQLITLGLPVTLLGYGIKDASTFFGAGQLRQTQTTILDPAYGELELRIDQSFGRGGCFGDSGAPLFAWSEGRATVIGVESRGQFDPRSKCRVSMEFTRVPAVLRWIADATAHL